MNQILELLISSANGVYVPQIFAEKFNPQNSYWVWDYEGLKDDLSNPENESYWESWEQVLNTAYYLEDDKKYSLHSGDDLWAIKDGYGYDDNENLIHLKTGKIVEL